jgi:hypothetical protein
MTDLLFRKIDAETQKTYLQFRKMLESRAPKGCNESPFADYSFFRETKKNISYKLKRMMVLYSDLENKLSSELMETIRALYPSKYFPAKNTLLPYHIYLGMKGADQWTKKGIPISALGRRPIFPSFSVFPPTRQVMSTS